MAIFLGAKGTDVLLSRGAVDLSGSLKETLTEKMAYLLPGEQVALLLNMQGRLQEELAFEKESQAGFAGIMAELEGAVYEDMLPSLHQRYRRMAVYYFARRGSVLAFHGLCNAWLDSLVCKVLELAAAGLELADMGKPPVPYCLLATGVAGREEQALAAKLEYFLVYAEDTGNAADYFNQFAYRIIAVLEACGMVLGGDRMEQGQKIWHGSAASWRRWVEDELHREPAPHPSLLTVLPSFTVSMKPLHQEDWERSPIIFTIADLRVVCGDHQLTSELMDFVRSMVMKERETETFTLLARKVVAMPVALGFFGGFRVERHGEHRGEFNVEEFALAPLVLNVAILACKYGLLQTGTIPRIKGLVEGGRLGVELGERLLRAFHEFSRQRIVQVVNSAAVSPSGFYLNPDNLEEEDMKYFKNGLESLTTLQKIIYQVFSEQG